jgi:hypothetical protein
MNDACVRLTHEWSLRAIRLVIQLQGQTEVSQHLTSL